MTKEAGCKGFTLIEMAVAVMVSSILLTGLIPLYHAYLTSQIILTTNSNMTSIVTSLANYKSLNGILPCPASPTAKPGDENYGVSDTAINCTTVNHVTTCTQACNNAVPPPDGTIRVTNPNLSPGPASQVRIGAVPFATLGIGETTTLDGWGNQYEYAVSEQLADSSFPFDYSNGAITLYNGYGPSEKVEGPLPNHTPFMLVSFGPTGHGAYTPAGKQHAFCGILGPQETNCSNTGVFRNMPYSANANDQYRFDNITSASLNQEIGGSGGGVVSLKKPKLWMGNGPHPPHPACIAPFTTQLSQGNFDTGSLDGSNTIYETICQADTPYNVIYLKCGFHQNTADPPLPANVACGREDPPNPFPPCPTGWTSLYTGVVINGSGESAPGWYENVCYQ